MVSLSTKVQKEVIPLAISGESLMVESATGSGKTHSFMIPILQKLDEDNKSTQAVIISPTRELATLKKVYKKIAKIMNDNSALLEDHQIINDHAGESELLLVATESYL